MTISFTSRSGIVLRRGERIQFMNHRRGYIHDINPKNNTARIIFDINKSSNINNLAEVMDIDRLVSEMATKGSL